MSQMGDIERSSQPKGISSTLCCGQGNKEASRRLRCTKFELPNMSHVFLLVLRVPQTRSIHAKKHVDMTNGQKHIDRSILTYTKASLEQTVEPRKVPRRPQHHGMISGVCSRQSTPFANKQKLDRCILRWTVEDPSRNHVMKHIHEQQKLFSSFSCFFKLFFFFSGGEIRRIHLHHLHAPSCCAPRPACRSRLPRAPCARSHVRAPDAG